MNTIIKLIILLVILYSCQPQEKYEIALDSDIQAEVEIIPITRQESVSPTPPPLPPLSIEKAVGNEKKIIKDGRLGFSVKNLEEAKSEIDTLVQRYGAYYENESYNNTRYRVLYELKVRIPSDNLEKFIYGIGNGGWDLLYKEITARDVTEEFYDLSTRLENKNTYLLKYKKLLNKAKSIKEILEIEEKIRLLVEEIESVQGRLDYMNDQVDFSTLHISLRTEKEYQPSKQDGFFERIKDSLEKGWLGIITFLLFFVKIWPIIILIPFGIYFIRKYKRKK